MAKSLRSKVKRSFRSKKRETGVYAAADAARLNRLNSKLVQVTKGETEPSEPVEEDDVPGWCWFATFGLLDPNDITLDAQTTDDTPEEQPESMEVDSKEVKVSTHGPRNSRREQWRTSKGLAPRGTSHGMNRQGTVAAKRKAGRPSRRR
ncbi:hypothetical protein D9619_000955 [Psilocybe cf. subviscida]|uniref:DUF2423 domain-containing protein n=1 Tax=Psilocybe cf. subviscida TaxID=2480587 RepID=A0A8H5BEK4_9AGAR|nr:hypothetical protein D9619_000955 [Psilocybe cf. subviscida]